MATEAVDRALHRALALDPAERFGSLAEFVRALGWAVGGTLPGGVAAIQEPMPAPVPSPEPAGPAGQPSRRLVLALCLLAAVVIAVVLFAIRK
jgi:hypothetical protein